MFIDKYPYSDLHELNLDWIISQMKNLENKFDALKLDVITEAVYISKEYTDDRVKSFFEDIERLENDIENFKNLVNGEFNAFTLQINTEIINMTNQINEMKSFMDNLIRISEQRTDVLIEQNNQLLFAELSKRFRELTVVNYFTGKDVTVQEMFDYLAQLHLDDRIDYDTMTDREKTYTYLAALNITYTQLVTHGNTLYV